MHESLEIRLSRFIYLILYIKFHAKFSAANLQIVISPGNITTVAGSTAVLACVGYGGPSVTWSKDGVMLGNNSRVTIYDSQVTEGGFTFAKSILEICGAQDTDSGQYSCSIESVGDTQMNDSATFELSVTPNVGRYEGSSIGG